MVRMLGGAFLLGTTALAGAAEAAETIRYKYDARGRLVQVVRTGVPGHDTKVAYTYDRANNRRSKS